MQSLIQIYAYWLIQMIMNCWLFSIIYVISICTATEILYVLPDNVSDVNCPSQPCATLGQYLLDNGSLPVLSNVEYRFLPGEHHLANIINIEKAFNFSLNGIGLSPASLVCWSHVYYVSVLNSYNVTVTNLVFNQCNGDLYYKTELDIAAGLLLYECSHCQVEDVYFFGYGFVGINLCLDSHLHNITIDMTITGPTVNMCSPKFVLMFLLFGEENSSMHDFISINQLSINGYNEICYELHEAVEIQLYKSYGMHIKLFNSQFYNIDQLALIIRMQNTDASLLIYNCTFKYIEHKTRRLHRVVYGEIAVCNVNIRFERCTFYRNAALTLFYMLFTFYNGLCTFPSNVTIQNCDYVDNHGELLSLSNYVPECKANIFLSEAVNLAYNRAKQLMVFSFMAVSMNGTISVLKNNVTQNIITFEYCDIIFSRSITFRSNTCTNVILLTSVPLHYIMITEYANITFINTTYHQLLIATGPIINNYGNIFPYCIFQYMLLTSVKSNVSELLTLYTINFSENVQNAQASTVNFSPKVSSINNFLDHCKWLPTAVFNSHDPGYINQRIIQVDGQQWIHHNEICVCPHDAPYNCTVNLLGPVYPGQMLKVDLCMPQADRDFVVYTAVTDSISLQDSTCNIAHETEQSVVNIGRNYSGTFNYKIVSDIKLCELPLIAWPFVRAAFYVQLSPCPVGFTLQNGTCGCDPFLPPDIDTCYIDLSAIRRPANTWITAHTLTNNTKNYLISDCPMDYCLPYSTNVNLLHPDLQCQFNRTGILCSQCPHPLSMVFASSRCMKCTNVHILITIIVIVAGIVLVVLLYVLNLTVTNGTINGIIFYANIVSINDSVFLENDNVFKPLRVFISFANLDLGIKTCFYNGMDSYIKMWLQLFFPSYLIFIAVSIIIASRYSSRILRLTYRRSLPVLATLFLLSYTGVLRVILTVLFSYSTITHYPSGDKQIVWSIDASVPLFGLKFTILFITCIVLFLLLVFFCITLLSANFLLKFRILKPLLDTFQCSYKDKFNFWVALNLVFRSIFFSLYAFQGTLRLFLTTGFLVVITTGYGYVCPNKNKAVNIQNLLLLVNLTIMYAVLLLNNEKIFSIVMNFLITLTFIQFCITVLYHFLTYTVHVKEKLIECLTIKKRK